MEPYGEHLRQHALALASVAAQLADSAGDRSSAPHLPAALACIEQTLDALSRTYERTARSLVPAEDPFEPWSHRFARAARDWPAARDGAGPSFERQAELMTALHAAGDSLRVARRECAHAREVVLETMAPAPPHRPDARLDMGPRMHSACAAARTQCGYEPDDGLSHARART